MSLIFMFEDLWRRRDATASHRGGGRVGVDKSRGVKYSFNMGLLDEYTALPVWYGGDVVVRTNVLEARIKAVGAKYAAECSFASDGSSTSAIEFDVSDAVSGRWESAEKLGAARKWKFDLDYEGSDSEAHLKLGDGRFGGVKYLRSVTKALSLGADAFWLAEQSSVGFAARYADKRSVATAQLASVGLVFLTYTKVLVPKVRRNNNEQVMLANEFMWNWHTRKAHVSVGFDLVDGETRGRFRVDSAGTASTFYERHVSATCSSWATGDFNIPNRNFKCGVGITAQAM